MKRDTFQIVRFVPDGDDADDADTSWDVVVHVDDVGPVVVETFCVYADAAAYVAGKLPSRPRCDETAHYRCEL